VPCGGGITKLTSTGTVDPTFVTGTGLDPHFNLNPSYMVRIGAETSFYVAGYFTEYNGITVNHIMKLDTLGIIDPSFNSGSGFNNVVYGFFGIWGNKLWVLGDFTSYNGLPAYYMAVLNADGSLLYGADADYYTPVVLGNNIVAKTVTGCLKTIFTNPNPVTTTTTTAAPTTSTTTSSTTAGPVTTTTTKSFVQCKYQ
jgi:hypothetical protein